MSTLVVFTGLAGLMYATTLVAAVDVKESRLTIDDLRAQYLAETGLERGVHYLGRAVDKMGSYDPLGGLQALFGSGDEIVPIVAEQVRNGQAAVGAITVAMRLIDSTATSVSVEIEASGYLPDAPANLPPGERLRSWHAVAATVTYSLEPSGVFDNAYFINNWGWLYGNSIYCNGNVRSNGQLDFGGYAPTVAGQPTYDAVDWDGVQATLTGYHDDNGDGALDGKDGGSFSGWDIVNAGKVKGNGGKSENMHDFQDRIEMPNLTDLTYYEGLAKARGSSIQIDGTVVCDGVVGDSGGEKQSLYLVGTASKPIVLDGPVVVRGDVIISGYVTGQGSIYAGGNVYVPESVKYVDPPTSWRPSDVKQEKTEEWLSDNWNKDFLGLYARENIVVGDYTNSTWQANVKNWMKSSMNQSAEDAGEDGIPNTAAGRDGIHGTADDDVLEGDGDFTVEHYTEEDAALGLIPPGKSVGDAIPGTGEDIDGDGQYDDTTTLSDLTIDYAIDPTYWEGNVPSSGVSKYSNISSLYANQLDAVLYTNHSFCWAVFGSSNAQVNGSLVSRNENIVYGTPKLEFNYDCRLLGGTTGMAGDLLPRTMAEPTVTRWRRLESDPNHYRVVED